MATNNTKSHVLEWLHIAKWAASGGNAQPWKVDFDEDGEQIIFRLTIDSEVKSERSSPLDVGGRASIMALGTLTFNIEAAAAHDGYALKYKVFSKENSFWDDEVFLFFEKEEGVVAKYSLEEMMLRRTDRNSYTKSNISETLVSDLKNLFLTKSNETLVTDATDLKKETIKGFKQLELLRWKDDAAVDSLLQEITLKASEDQSIGIPIDQLGISIVDQVSVKLLKAYPPLRVLLKKGGQHMLTYQNLVRPISNSDRIYFIQAKDDSLKNIFEMGYLYQQVWTEINRQGYAFQPIGVPLFGLGIVNKVERTTEEQKALSVAREFLHSELGLNIELPILGFRTGKAKKPVARSNRREIHANLVENLAGPLVESHLSPRVEAPGKGSVA